MILFRLFSIISLTHATYLYFEYPSYEISILESIEISTRITRIQAIASPQLAIRYVLHGDTNQTFALRSSTGELILLKSLDYETIPIYKLTIEARSSSSIVTSSFTELIIDILNVNDHPPEMNLIIYPSIIYRSHWIALDRTSLSNPFATITIKDLDPSTENLTLSINNTEYFQLQLIRQRKNLLLYLLSTRNNLQLLSYDHFNVSFTACDGDQPSLCTNQTYQFHFQSTEYLCNLSFEQTMYIIDINENLPKQSLLMSTVANQFCANPSYSIDDRENFYLDSSTGDLFTSKNFNRTERSIYPIHLLINNHWKIDILVRLVDQNGSIPFLIHKKLRIHPSKFSSLHLFNSTSCRSQSFIEDYFQLFSNCTLVPINRSSPHGQYLLHIELDQHSNLRDTFLLELDDEHQRTWTQSLWIRIIIPLLGIFLVLCVIIIPIMIIKQKRAQFDQRASPLSIEDESQYHKYEPFTPTSKLKVHDDHQLASSQRATAIYLVGKPSPAISSLSPVRDDEGYSGSSDASDQQHLPCEITILSANDLLEQYRIHDFHPTSKKISLYDVPRRSMDKINVLPRSADISLV